MYNFEDMNYLKNEISKKIEDFNELSSFNKDLKEKERKLNISNF